MSAAHTALRPVHLLGTRTLDDGEWAALLDAADQLQDAELRADRLAGRTLGLLMLNPSLRTRTSFQVAARQLGASVVELTPGAGLWQLEHRDDVVMDGVAAEHLREAIPVLCSMLDGLGFRCFAGLEDAASDRSEPVLSAVARLAGVPVLNLESAADHPHQALADALTVRRQLDGRRARVAVTWAPHIKPLPQAVAHGAVAALAREGHDVVLAHPPGFDLDPNLLHWSGEAARRAGGSLTVTHDRAAALDGAQVIYAKSWGSPRHYGDDRASEEAVRDPDRAHWRLTTDDLARGADPIVMHCLPVRRGVVMDGAVLDGPASRVQAQAAARLDVQRATLCRAFGALP